MCGDPPRDLLLPPQRTLTHWVHPPAHPLCKVWGPLGPCLAFSSIPTLCLYGSKVGDAVGSGRVWMVEGTGRILLDCMQEPGTPLQRVVLEQGGSCGLLQHERCKLSWCKSCVASEGVMGSREGRIGAASALQGLIEPRDEWAEGRGGAGTRGQQVQGYGCRLLMGREQLPQVPERVIVPSPASRYLLPDVGLWVVHVDLLGVVPNEVDEPMQGGTAWGREVLGDEGGSDHTPQICKEQPSAARPNLGS